MSQREEKEERTDRLKNLVYDNRRRLEVLEGKFFTLRNDFLAILDKLKRERPPDSAKIKEVQDRLDEVEKVQKLYIEGIMHQLQRPAAATKIAEAEEEIEKVRGYFTQGRGKRTKIESPRKSRPPPKEWKVPSPPDPTQKKKEDAEWSVVLKDAGVQPVDKGEIANIPTQNEDLYFKFKKAAEDQEKVEAERRRREAERKRKAEGGSE